MLLYFRLGLNLWGRSRFLAGREGGGSMEGDRLLCTVSGGILPQKILKFQVLENTISAIQRQSQYVLISHFFKVKMPFFLHQNITKRHKNNANLHL